MPLRCTSQGYYTFCSGETRASTMYDIHKAGSAGLTSGGIHIVITVEICLHQNLSFCLVLIQGCPTYQHNGFAAMLPPLPVMLRFLTHVFHLFCGLDMQSVGLKNGVENNKWAGFSPFLNEIISFVCTCT